MAPRNSTRSTKSFRARDVLRFLPNIFAQYYPLVVVVILIADLVLAAAIVQQIPYTEIDWKAYTQQVSFISTQSCTGLQIADLSSLGLRLFSPPFMRQCYAWYSQSIGYAI
jgi:ALG3 protein